MNNKDIENIKVSAFSLDKTLFYSKVDDLVNKVIINKKEILTKIISFLDITTLNNTDNKKAIENIIPNLTCRVGERQINVAGICIYSNLLPILNNYSLPKEIKRVVVSGGFPTGQMSLEAKLQDINFALNNNADEIDIPINRGLFFENEKEFITELQILSNYIKTYHKEVKLKVILETSELESYKNIYKASMLAIENGADFIKTSTGKVSRGADIYSSVIMLIVIKEYFEKTNKIIGFKVAGGIRTWQEAIKYYILAENIIGKDFLNKETFRIGCSNLRDNILKEINEK